MAGYNNTWIVCELQNNFYYAFTTRQCRLRRYVLGCPIRPVRYCCHDVSWTAWTLPMLDQIRIFFVNYLLLVYTRCNCWYNCRRNQSRRPLHRVNTQLLLGFCDRLSVSSFAYLFYSLLTRILDKHGVLLACRCSEVSFYFRFYQLWHTTYIERTSL